MARGAVHGVRLMPLVHVASDLAAQREAAALLVRNSQHAEDLVRAHLHTFLLAFAAIAIDDWRKNAGGLLALGIGFIHG